MNALKSKYQKFIELHWAWMDKIVVANVEKAAAVKLLQAATEWEKELQEEIFCTMVELLSTIVELGSTE